jgi:hypothetical protein
MKKTNKDGKMKRETFGIPKFQQKEKEIKEQTKLK